MKNNYIYICLYCLTATFMSLLVGLCFFYFLNLLSLLIVFLNILCFGFFLFFLRKNKLLIYKKIKFYITFNFIYGTSFIFFLFQALYFNFEFVFLSPKTFAVVIGLVELVIYVIVNLDFYKLRQRLSYRVFKIGKKEVLIEQSKKKNNKSGIKKVTFSFIILSILSASCFALSGSFSKDGRLDFFTQSITYAERSSDITTYLSFQKKVNNNVYDLAIFSKNFTDSSYPGKTKYAPLSVKCDNGSNNYSKPFFNDVEISFLSFYTFDAYAYKNEWVSSYNGLRFFGPKANTQQVNFHSAFLSYSLAEKILKSKPYSELRSLIGDTFLVKIGNVDFTFFVSNIILDNTVDYKCYIKNYGDFLILPRNDALLSSDNTFIDFYFDKSSSYNKDLLRFILRSITNDSEWSINSNYHISQSFQPSNFLKIKSNGIKDILSFLFVTLSILCCISSFILSIKCIFKRINFFFGFFVIFFGFMVIQTVLYCLWQFFGTFYLPSSSVCLFIGFFIFTFLFYILSRKEEALWLSYSNPKNFFTISI